MEKLEKHCFNQMIKVNITADSMYPWYDGINFLCNPSPNSKTSLIIRKLLDKSQPMGIL